MLKILRRLLVIVLLLGAWALVGSDRVPVPLTLPEAVASTAHAQSPFEPSGRSEKPVHELSALRVFTKVILYVKDNYVDPKRVKPKEMMISALEYVEKTVPEVLVDGNAETGRLRVNVNGKTRDFDINHVDTLWKMSFTLKDVFDFISRNMRPIEDTREVEYAAVNGMLSTLDPHSVLLRPEMYREMKLTTTGEFGGLGFVIQMKEGNLTVVRVLPKTPAWRAGIKKDDQIKKIGEESTVNMDLNEAVGKLRGPVDTKVTITVDRKSWDRPQTMTLARALINIESVQSKLLAQGVGYVRLKNFQGNTTRHLNHALQQLSDDARAQGNASGLKGLVLDLRGNPGGLLEQAISVSDLFLAQGTIVATVGLSDKLREEKKAHADEGDDAYPVAVLVNAGSASASEIVAGALKNMDRAVIIGRQTFGKGSVQVLYDFPDESALKLTIAKYLTPGDLSIQEVGITPDIQLIPTRVSKDRVDVFAPRRTMGEADLDRHFGNPNNQQAVKKRDDVVVREKPAETLKYLKDEPKAVAKAEDKPKRDEKAKKDARHPLTDAPEAAPEELDDQLDAETQDEVREDFEVQFARDFLVRAPFVERLKMLEAGKAYCEQRRREEEERINGAISALGIDWTAGESAKNPQLVATLKPGPDKRLLAGETVQVDLTVENRGAETVRRLRAWTDSANPILDRREFLFGALKPGDKRTWSVPIKLPKDMISRRDGVTVKLSDDGGQVADAYAGELNFVELPRPAFAYQYQLVDACRSCNGDGQAQRGEEFELLVDVTNLGPGKAMASYAQIKNAADSNIFIVKGRFTLGELAAGETKTARFSLEVKPSYKQESFALKLAIIDEPVEEFTADKLVIKVAEPSPAVEGSRATVRLVDRAEVFGSTSTDQPPLARFPKGALLAEVGRAKGVVKVEWAKDRTGFVKAQEAREARGARPAPPKDIEHLTYRDPPQIALSVDPAQGGVQADSDHFTLTGTVTSRELLDMYVLVNDQKVFFKTAAEASDGKLRFTTDFPLKEGVNGVLVVARESADFSSRRSVVIRRRPAAVAQKLSADALPKQ